VWPQYKPFVKVWAGGTAVYQIGIINHDNLFCKKIQFDFTINNFKELVAMGFEWWFDPQNVELDPGASANPYLFVKTPPTIDEPTNVTLSLNVSSFDTNSGILYSVQH
jgi:hypothetical protein